MLRKKATLTVHNGRGAIQFFNRIQDVFERKFDGFPAKAYVSSTTTPGAPTSDLGEIDFGAIAEEIAESILNNNTPECGDVSVADCISANCSGKSVTETLASASEFTALFEPSLAVAYYVTVWINGLVAVVGEDYVVNSDKTIILNGGSSADEVIARYVVV